MIWNQFKKIFAISREEVSADISEQPDFVARWIAALTAVFMGWGFLSACGVQNEQGITALAVLTGGGCFGILYRRHHAPASREAIRRRSEEVVGHARPGTHIVLHTPDTIYKPRHIPSWLALAGAAGGVNGFAFLACEEFVSHITGTSTRIGLEWPHIGVAIEYGLVLASFICGAVASVLWLQARACRGRRPRWATPLRAVALILTAAAILGHYGSFGPFGGNPSGEPPFLLLSVLAFAMGLQNAAVASTTGLAVRTTHLTGPATDLGIHLGTMAFATGKERSEAFRGAALRLGKIAAFILGAALALPLANRFGFLCLLAPAVLVLFAAALSFLPQWSPSDIPICKPKPSGDDC